MEDDAVRGRRLADLLGCGSADLEHARLRRRDDDAVAGDELAQRARLWREDRRRAPRRHRDRLLHGRVPDQLPPPARGHRNGGRWPPPAPLCTTTYWAS